MIRGWVEFIFVVFGFLLVVFIFCRLSIAGVVGGGVVFGLFSVK